MIQPIVDLLTANKATIGAKDVQGVADLLQAMETLRSGPSVFVVRGAGRAGPSTGNTYVAVQDATQSFDVVTGVDRATLRSAPAMIDTAAAAIERLLVGWDYAGSGDLVEFRSDGWARVDFDKGLLFFRQTFSYGRTIRSDV